MNRALDDILQRVAAGELTPEEALRLIDARSPGDALHEPGSGRDDEPEGVSFTKGGRSGPIRTVRLLAAYRHVTVVADPTVTHAHVSGRHTVRQEGDLLTVDGSWNPFAALGEEDSELRFAFAALPRSLAWATSWPDEQLTVRIHPHVRLEVDATGSSLRISGPEAGAWLRLLATSLKVDRLRGPLDLDARASSVKGSLGPTGESRIAAEQSSIKVGLLPGVSLRLAATNRMGKVVMPGRTGKDGRFGETVHGRVGSGADSLMVDASMSTVVIGLEGQDGGR